MLSIPHVLATFQDYLKSAITLDPRSGLSGLAFGHDFVVDTYVRSFYVHGNALEL
jgi:hypothetical protein